MTESSEQEIWKSETLHFDVLHPRMRLYSKLISAHKNEFVQKVLDLGCSMGTLGHTLSPQYFSYQGADFAVDDPKVIKLDMNNLPLPFQDGEYDIISCNGSLEYVVDLAAFFGEVHRILKTSGLFIASYLNKDAFIQKILKVIWPSKFFHKTVASASLVQIPEFRNLLHAHFQDIHEYGILLATPLSQPSWSSKFQSNVSWASMLSKADGLCHHKVWTCIKK